MSTPSCNNALLAGAAIILVLVASFFLGRCAGEQDLAVSCSSLHAFMDTAGAPYKCEPVK